MIRYMLLVSRQGKVRLAKWFVTLPSKTKTKIAQEVTQLTLARKPRMCNFLEYKGRKLVYRRYASLFFICEIDEDDNELIALELIHRFVEILDRYFGNVCELDLVYNFHQAYAILDEVFTAGELQEPSRKAALTAMQHADSYESVDTLRATLESTHLA